MPNDDEALRWYLEELAWLRGMGAEFARKHQKVAASLDFSAVQSSDPHVERLIESFAFLTARIQRNLEAEFPRIATALLGVLYPQLVHPIPPMAIARFEPDPKIMKVPTGHPVPTGTQLIARGDEGLTCRFRTCYDILLWPLEVTKATLLSTRDLKPTDPDVPGSPNVLRLNISSSAGPLSQLKLSELRFFIGGLPSIANTLYDLLVTGVSAIHIRPGFRPDEQGPKSQVEPVSIDPRRAIRQVGFRTEDEVIPCPSQSHPGYRLIQEYFHFPEKFRFIDLRCLDQRPIEPDKEKDYDSLEILIYFDRSPGRIHVSTENFMLGCAPIVNLFPKMSEPVRVNHRSLEYRLVADVRRESTTEIYSIETISASTNAGEKAPRYQPFYSFRHNWDGPEPRAFWMARRAPTGRADLPGTDMWLSFLNLDFKPENPADEVIYAHMLCTNRDLARQVREGDELQMDSPTPAHAVSVLVRPTPPAPPLIDGPTVWRLVSNLSLNQLSLNSSAHALASLREILRVYALADRPSVESQIDGIAAVKPRRVVRRVATKISKTARQWDFRTGTHVTLTFDETMYTGSSAILLASVLRHFLALHTSINSFVKVSARRARDEKDVVWKSWAPVSGQQPVR